MAQTQKVKLEPKVLITMIIIIAAAVGLVFLLTPNAHEKITRAYDNLDNDHILVSIDASDMLDMVEEEEGPFLVLLSRPTCPACQTQIGFINEAAVRYDFETIYYIDVRYLSNSETADLEDLGVTTRTPNLLVFKDGEFLEESLSNSTWENYAGDEAYYEAYRRFIKEVLDL